jgi:YggT family protein
MIQILCVALQIYFYVVLVRIILSWITQLPEPVLPLARGVRAVTDPVLTPLRNALPPLRVGAGAIDFSPIVLFLAIAILRGLLGCR